MDLGESWLNLHRLTKVLDSATEISLPGKKLSKVKIGSRVFRVDAQGIVKLCSGLLQPTLALKNQTQVVVYVGIQGIQRKGLLIAFYCLIQISALGKNPAQVVVRYRRFWI